MPVKMESRLTSFGKTVIWLILSLSLMIGCHPEPESKTAYDTIWRAGSDVAPSSIETDFIIKMGISDIYCKDSSCDCVRYIADRDYREVFKILWKRWKIKVIPLYFSDPYQLTEAIEKGEIAAVIAKPWLAIRQNRNNHRVFKRIADIYDPNGNRFLCAKLIVLKDSPLKRLEDLPGKSLAIGQNDAYEKYYAILDLLKRNRLSGKIKLVQRASCIENVSLLLDHKADAAVVSDYIFYAGCAIDLAKEKDFRVLGVTEKMPLTSVMVNVRKVDAHHILRLQNALFAISRQGLPRSFKSKGIVLPYPWKIPMVRIHDDKSSD